MPIEIKTAPESYKLPSVLLAAVQNVFGLFRGSEEVWNDRETLIRNLAYTAEVTDDSSVPLFYFMFENDEVLRCPDGTECLPTVGWLRALKHLAKWLVVNYPKRKSDLKNLTMTKLIGTVIENQTTSSGKFETSSSGGGDAKVHKVIDLDPFPKERSKWFEWEKSTKHKLKTMNLYRIIVDLDYASEHSGLSSMVAGLLYTAFSHQFTTLGCLYLEEMAKGAVEFDENNGFIA